MDSKDKGFAIFAGCVVAALLAVAGINLYQAHEQAPIVPVRSYSQFLDAVAEGQVRSVTLTGNSIAGRLTDGSPFRSYAANDPDLVRDLRANHVAIGAIAPPPAASGWASSLGSLLPMLVLFALAYFFLRRSAAGGVGGGIGLGKSRARQLPQIRDRVTFDDVAGVDEARESLQEIVDFLRTPEKFELLGGRIPRGVLLVGPPGTGKTLLARAVAGEADVPFFTISGSDFVEMFVGVGASRIRSMFEVARKSAPCIIFMDEIDAVGRRRGAGVGGGNDEREQTLNQLLVEMDGFGSSQNVIMIAATNRPDILDPALLRPGRFDREVVVANPDIVGREHILRVHARKVPLADDADLVSLARHTPGFSGADLMNLVNEAALLAARRGRREVGMREFEEAKDTVTMGAERRTHVMSAAEKRQAAYREAGRVLVALQVPAGEPLPRATIITRGRSKGLAKRLSDIKGETLTVRQMRARLAILMAARASEEIVFGRDDITSSGSIDIEQATKLARIMVTRWGLSEKLGTMTYEEDQEDVFLGQSMGRNGSMADETAQAVASEVRALIEGGMGAATAILHAHRDQLDLLAQGLLKYETLNDQEMRALLDGKPPARTLDNGDIEWIRALP